jgi:phosphoenolpyruvate-protein kinase (PTS system EI component)
VRIPAHELLGVVSGHGGALSHAAILARALGIPAVVGLTGVTRLLEPGSWVEIDGDSGTVTILGKSAARSYVRSRSSDRGFLNQQPAATADGHPINLQANIGSLADVEYARAIGLRGSGLVRTEFLFSGDDPPDITTQSAIYREISEAFPGGAVFRLLDCGSDKPVSYVSLRPSPNPALGERGVRALLANPELLETQLRALSDVHNSEPIRVMVPMITDVAELREIRKLAAPLFAAAGTRLSLGAMVEVPTAALAARELAIEADFLSIGTNDLIQYLCAVDRSAAELNHLIDPVPPAVWRVLRDVIAAGGAAGIPVGVCGELAGDLTGAGALVALGATSLSVAPMRAGNVAQNLARRRLDEWMDHANTLLAEPAEHNDPDLPHLTAWANLTNGSIPTTSPGPERDHRAP